MKTLTQNYYNLSQFMDQFDEVVCDAVKQRDLLLNTLYSRLKALVVSTGQVLDMILRAKLMEALGILET